MEYVKDFFGNCVFTVPILTWVVAQIVKMLVNLLRERKLDFERLIGGGGMPSCHSATVTALVAMTGWTCGFNSVFFAISAILAAVVMHDAMGVRWQTGKQSSSLKKLSEIIGGIIGKNEDMAGTSALKELVGHTPLQVLLGFLLGLLVAILYCIIRALPYGCFFTGLVI